jgi:hypothetical protein
MQFAIGTDMKAALVEVLGRLNRVPPLPREVDRRWCRSAGAAIRTSR